MEWKRHCTITKKNVWVQRYFKYDWYTRYIIFNGLSNNRRCNSSFVTTYDVNFLFFFLQTFRHHGIAVFGTMPPMCRGCPDVNKRGMDTTISGQHWPFMSIKSFVKHGGWRDGVPMLANPFTWRVRWPRPARVPLFSLGLKVPRSPCGYSGRLVNSLSPTWG